MGKSTTGMYSNDLTEFLVSLGTSKSLDLGFERLGTLVSKLNFDAITYSAMPRSFGQPGLFQPVFLASSDFSPGFLSHYNEAGLWQKDFTIERILQGSMAPMHWDKELLESPMIDSQKQVIQLAQSDYHIRNAISIPTQSDRYIIAGASVVSSEPRALFDGLLADNLSTLQIAIFHFHQFVFYQTGTSQRFYEPLIDTFTPSERRLISFIASGRPLKQSKEFTGFSQSRAANILSSLYRRLKVANGTELSFLIGYHKLIDRIDI